MRSLGAVAQRYYRWATLEPSVREQSDGLVKEQIQAIHAQARRRYGYRPVHAHLVENGAGCGRDRPLRLMRELGLQAQQGPRYKPCSTQSAHLFGYSPNLLGELGRPEHRDQIWVDDTTYLLSDLGWRYLATVMDLCTRRIVGWSIAEHNDADLVCTALVNAVLSRGGVRAGIVHHSDRGSTTPAIVTSVYSRS